MAEDLMRYDQLAQNALRGVVREALRRVAATGLPGDHHFYIAFETRHPGVNISEKLLEKYPRDITIVIQHQYNGLVVHDDYFEVVLVFDQIPEKLVVPFSAVKGFLDPHVQFGLQFEVVHVEKKQAAPEAVAQTERTVAGEEAAEPKDNVKVVSLDAFRKK